MTRPLLAALLALAVILLAVFVRPERAAIDCRNHPPAYDVKAASEWAKACAPADERRRG